MRTLSMRKITMLLFTITLSVFAASSLVALDTPSELAEKVRKTLYHHYHGDLDQLDPAKGHINVEVNVTEDGKVILDGQTSTLYDKYRVFNIASRVPGVTEISNQLVVDTPPMPEAQIKQELRNAIQQNSAIIEKDRINISVDDGAVTLSGKVSYFKEKEMVQTMASWQKGVKAIDNNIEVLRPEKAMSDANLKKVLGELLENQFPTDQDNVTFTVENGIVTLKGNVNNLWHKKEIAEEFSEVIGVTQVHNYLKVTS